MNIYYIKEALEETGLYDNIKLETKSDKKNVSIIRFKFKDFKDFDLINTFEIDENVHILSKIKQEHPYL